VAKEEGMISRLSSLVFISILMGCSSGPPAGDLVAVRDSSGVRIVEHRAFPRDLPRYSLDLSKAATFDPRDTGLDLFGARGAFIDAEGNVIVADGGNFRILRFNPSGEVISSTGRNGQGPGEFGNLTLVSPWLADSLLAWDVNARRLSVFDSDGTFARAFTLELTDSIRGAFVQDVFEDGSLLAGGFTDTGGPIPTGRHRYPAPAYHFASDGSFRANLGLIPGTETYFEAFDGGFRTSPALFSRSTKKIACQNQLLIASNDRYEFEFLTQGGKLTQSVRYLSPPRPVTSELRGQAEAALLEEIQDPEARSDVRTTLAAMPMPETLPAYDRVFADRTGRVWLEDYQVVEEEAATWRVFSQDGTVLFTAEMPRRFDPTDAGEDYVLGVFRDSFDVESVVLTSLTLVPE
jgi:hypothetical protein